MSKQSDKGRGEIMGNPNQDNAPLEKYNVFWKRGFTCYICIREIWTPLDLTHYSLNNIYFVVKQYILSTSTVHPEYISSLNSDPMYDIIRKSPQFCGIMRFSRQRETLMAFTPNMTLEIENLVANMLPFQKTYCEHRAAGHTQGEAAKRAGSTSDGSVANRVGYQTENMVGSKDYIKWLEQERLKASTVDVPE